MINISSKVLLITLVSIVTVAMLMITLPIMAEISQLPHDQKNNATTNISDMLNIPMNMKGLSALNFVDDCIPALRSDICYRSCFCPIFIYIYKCNMIYVRYVQKFF